MKINKFLNLFINGKTNTKGGYLKKWRKVITKNSNE